MKIRDWILKIKRKWMKLRLQPIRVFCIHQVSEVFDESSMWECDWMSAKEFKDKVCALQKEYTFISLPDAYAKMKNDIFRCRKYAVLTADDGSKTLESILPWLQEQNIPITLFINGSYLDGKTYREAPTERYFTKGELMHLKMDNITFGHHGWDHRNLRFLSEEDFHMSMNRNMEALHDLPNLISFWAYPYGAHSQWSDETLISNGLTPVYIDKLMNYNNTNYIHRELL